MERESSRRGSGRVAGRVGLVDVLEAHPRGLGEVRIEAPLVFRGAERDHRVLDLTFQISRYSFSAWVSMSRFKSATMLKSHFCIWSGFRRSSLIKRSILLMYRTGRTRSSSACLVTVSV